MPHAPETRLTLIVRLKNARDEAAWREFLRLYEPPLLRMLRGQGLKEADALDVCQQALAEVAKDVEQWKPDGEPASFRRWLFRVARHRLIKFMTKERAGAIAEGGSGALERLRAQVDDGKSLSAELEREYRQQLLLTAGERIRGEFHDATWRAFWLSCVEGRSAAETACELQTTTGNVYVARCRIIARLREMVKELEGES